MVSVKAYKLFTIIICITLFSNVFTWFEIFEEEFEEKKKINFTKVAPKSIGVLEKLPKAIDYKQISEKETKEKEEVYMLFQKCSNTNEDTIQIRISKGEEAKIKVLDINFNETFKMINFNKTKEPYYIYLPNNTNEEYEEYFENLTNRTETVSFGYDYLNTKPNVTFHELEKLLNEFKGTINVTKTEVKRVYLKWNKIPEPFHVKEYHFYIIREDQDDVKFAEDYCYLENQLYKKKEKERFITKTSGGSNVEDNFFVHRGTYIIGAVAIIDKPFYAAIAYQKTKVTLGVAMHIIVSVTAAIVIGTTSTAIAVMNIFYHCVFKNRKDKVDEEEAIEEDNNGSLYSSSTISENKGNNEPNLNEKLDEKPN